MTFFNSIISTWFFFNKLKKVLCQNYTSFILSSWILSQLLESLCQITLIFAASQPRPCYRSFCWLSFMLSYLLTCLVSFDYVTDLGFATMLVEIIRSLVSYFLYVCFSRVPGNSSLGITLVQFLELKLSVAEPQTL